jgi:hypothetical protein
MSKGRVFLFLWDESEAQAAAQILRDWGWEVEVEWEDGARGGAAVKADPPAAAVFYLDHKPSHSRATAEYLAQTKATRSIPLIFVGGEGEGLDKTRAKLPGGKYIREAQLQATLEKVVA